MPKSNEMTETISQIPSRVSKPAISLSTEALGQSEKLCIRSDAFGLSAFISSGELQVEIGDLVQIDRVLYTEWALYVGDGNVIHIAGVDSEADMPTDIAMVKLSSLSQVSGISGVRVNNKIVGAKERGLEHLPVDQVIQNALILIDKTVHFNMLTRNSEHYVTEWKYGLGWSDQATVTLSVMKTLTSDHTVGHNVLVNSINAVLNSPGSPIARSPPNFSPISFNVNRTQPN